MAVQCRERVAEWTTQTLSIKNVQRKVYSIFAPPQHHRTRTPSTGVHLCSTYPGNWFSLSILLGTPNTDNSLFLSIIIKMVQPILYIATAPPHPLSIARDDDTIYNTFPVQESARGLGSTTIPIYQYNIHEYLRCPSQQPPLLASSFTHSLVDAPSRPSIYTQSLCTQQARTLSLNLLLLKNVFANPKFTVLGH